MGDWKKTRIGEFISERKEKYEPDADEILNLRKIEKITFADGKINIGKYKLTKTKQIIVEPGDLVFSGLNIEKGALSINQTDERLVVSANYSTCQIDYSVIDQEYLLRYIKSPNFKQVLVDNLKKDYGFTRPKHLSPLKIDLPDIKGQRKIVEHFKSIETEDAELKTELTHQQTLLKKLRQQILQEAIEGKLTEQWRIENGKLKMESASELLKRIQAEKAQLIKDKKIKKQKPLSPISEDEKPFALPEGWVWCRLGEVIHSANNGLYKQASFYTDDGVASLRMYNIQSGEVIFIKVRRVELSADELSKYELLENDLLFNRVNSRELVGKTAIIRKASEPLVYESMNMRLRLVEPFIAEYINRYLLIPNARNYFFNICKIASGQVSINQGQVFNLVIPLPQLAEQKAIVAKVEKLLAVCDQLEAQITNNQTHANALMQAVLKEAFTSNNGQSDNQKEQVAAHA